VSQLEIASDVSVSHDRGMNGADSPALSGYVASLHLHPVEPGAALQSVPGFEVVADQGIAGNPRYFGRISHRTGKPGRRQISLIEREQIAAQAAALGLKSIPPGAVRANVETAGIDLIALIGRDIRIGDALLHIYEARKPCAKMDAVCAGLRDLMEQNRQGVMAEIRRSGQIRVGDFIRVS
jgi:MOSC domain-containing protein YiiM